MDKFMYAWRQERAKVIWRLIAAWAIVLFLQERFLAWWQDKIKSRLD